MAYQQEMSRYDGNNEFFAHLPPLSPISSSILTDQSSVLDRMHVASGNHQRPLFPVPKLDFTKLRPDFPEAEENQPPPDNNFP